MKYVLFAESTFFESQKTTNKVYKTLAYIHI